MPQVMTDLSIDDIAKLITAMNHQELETLSLLLTEEGKDLLKRKQDLLLERVKFLSREEIFRAVS
jgi:hypothetical protein